MSPRKAAAGKNPRSSASRATERTTKPRSTKTGDHWRDNVGEKTGEYVPRSTQGRAEQGEEFAYRGRRSNADGDRDPDPNETCPTCGRAGYEPAGARARSSARRRS